MAIISAIMPKPAWLFESGTWCHCHLPQPGTAGTPWHSVIYFSTSSWPIFATYDFVTHCALVFVRRFINARRRIVQPLIDQKHREGRHDQYMPDPNLGYMPNPGVPTTMPMSMAGELVWWLHHFYTRIYVYVLAILYYRTISSTYISHASALRGTEGTCSHATNATAHSPSISDRQLRKYDRPTWYGNTGYPCWLTGTSLQHVIDIVINA